MTSEFWDSRYQGSDWVYGTKPNQFIAQQIDQMAPGSILFPAEGEGRNAIYAAHLGWEVYAFDQSEVGRSKSLNRAQEEKVILNYELTEFSSYKPKSSFDVIALCFFHLMPEHRKALHQSVIEWLKPGGTLILESYHKTQLGRSSGGPKHIDMLFSEDEITEDFKSLECTYLEVSERELSEGTHHNGPAMLLEAVYTKNST